MVATSSTSTNPWALVVPGGVLSAASVQNLIFVSEALRKAVPELEAVANGTALLDPPARENGLMLLKRIAGNPHFEIPLSTYTNIQNQIDANETLGNRALARALLQAHRASTLREVEASDTLSQLADPKQPIDIFTRKPKEPSLADTVGDLRKFGHTLFGPPPEMSQGPAPAAAQPSPVQPEVVVQVPDVAPPVAAEEPRSTLLRKILKGKGASTVTPEDQKILEMMDSILDEEGYLRVKVEVKPTPQPQIEPKSEPSPIPPWVERFRRMHLGFVINRWFPTTPVPQPVPIAPAAGESFAEAAPKWKLLRYLGGGGMAVAFLAFDTQLNRHVVIKVARPDFTSDTVDPAKLFENEIKTQASLGITPHVLSAYDAGATVIDKPFLVLQLASGDAETLIRRGDVSDWRLLIQLLTDHLKGPEQIHDAGFLHRDIKPTNIFYITNAKNGDPISRHNTQLLLADFGLAKKKTAAAQETALMCTPIFTAPEAVQLNFSTQSDVFALGCTFYQMLAGKHPFYEHCERNSQDTGGVYPWMSELWADDVCPPSVARSPILYALYKTLASTTTESPVKQYANARELRKALLQDDIIVAAIQKSRKLAEAFQQAKRDGTPVPKTTINDEILADYQNAAAVRKALLAEDLMPPELDDILLKAIKVDPKDRHADAGELRSALVDFENWLTADEKWKEATEALTMARESLDKGLKELWIQHARRAYTHAREALRIYQEPEWLDITIRVLKKTLDIAEADGNTTLIDEVHQHMMEISTLCGSIIDSTPVFSPILMASNQPGEMKLAIRRLPSTAMPIIQIHELKEVGGVIKPVAEIDTSQFSLRPTESDGWLFDANLPRGNYQITLSAPGYFPMREVLHLPRGGLHRQNFDLLLKSEVPEGYLPIVGGIVDYSEGRKFNVPTQQDPEAESMRDEVAPFLTSQFPVTNLDYLRAMALIAFHHALESDLTPQAWSRGLELASQTRLLYFDEGKTTKFLRPLFQSWLPHRGQDPLLSFRSALTVYLRDERELANLLDYVGDTIVWDAPAVWTDLAHVPGIIAALDPKGRLPLVKEIRRLMVGGDRRAYPWGDSPPLAGYGYFNLISSKGIPIQSPLKRQIADGDPYYDNSPLGLREFGYPIPGIVETRAWTSEIATQGAESYPLIIGVGYSAPFTANPLQSNFGEKPGKAAAAVGIRIHRNYPKAKV